jgi:hypothetical protein
MHLRLPSTPMSRLGERNHRITTGVQMLIERRSKCQGFRVGLSTLLEKKLCDQERMHGSYSAALMMVGKDTCRSHQSHDLYEDDLHFALAMVRRAKLRVHSFGSLHFTPCSRHHDLCALPCRTLWRLPITALHMCISFALERGLSIPIEEAAQCPVRNFAFTY